MKSYSFNPSDVSGNRYYEIWNTIENNKGYFRKFCREETDEAIQATLLHSLTHYDPNKGNLKFYILSLARDITRIDGNLVLVDFLEKTLGDNTEEERKPVTDKETNRDIGDSVVEEIYLAMDRYSDVAELALTFMDMFLQLCVSLINKDSSTRYYSEIFIKESLKISKKCKNFNSLCIDIYTKYGKAMQDFLALDNEKHKDWREVNFSYLNNRQSKRVLFCDREGNSIVDADRQDYEIKGNVKGKHIVKVNYLDTWYHLCDIVDDLDISPLKFSIGDKVVYRTLGGSQTIVNVNVENFYELLKNEILLNVLTDLDGRIINIGSENFYILCENNDNFCIPDRTISGIDIKFNGVNVMF